MDSDDAARVKALTEAVADGIDVDWRSAESTVADVGARELLEQLRIIANLTKTPHDPEVVPEPEARAAVPSSAPEPPATREQPAITLTSWHHLAIRGQIGQGTYGTVFRAWDASLQLEVALKLLHSIRPGDEDAIVDEARLLAQVRHSNVVTILGAHRSQGYVGLWMELVQGRTFKELQEEQGPCSAGEAVVFGLALCQALAAVHRAGFLHRDVKAQNVMREAGGRIVLMDFGSAAAVQNGFGRARSVKGTPSYLAPEVLEGEGQTVRSDLYSLGVLLYYMVSGEFPVTGRSLDELRRAHARGQRKRLSDARPDLPFAFVSVVEGSLAARPDQRPDTAGTFEDLLASSMGRASTPARTVSRERPRPADGTRSIAVLPFVDMTPDGSLGVFCEGIAEDVIDALTKVGRLRVVARSSAFRFNRAHVDISHVGEALNVDVVLEGSVRTASNRLRVIARLVDTRDRSQLWSARFNRTLDDLFSVQDEIAVSAAAALGLIISVPGGTGDLVVEVPRPRVLDAYAFYVKGRHYWNQRTEPGLRKAVECFEAAVTKDPSFAEAYSGLAAAHATLGTYGVVSPHDAMPRAKHAVARAMEIDGTLASAFATAGCVAAVYDWAWVEAEDRFRRAIDLNPNHPMTHQWYAINYLVPLERFAEADQHLQRATDVDPLSMPIRLSVGLRYYFARQYEEARRGLRDCFELDAGAAIARQFLGLSLIELGAFDDAIRELDTAIHLSRSPEMVAARGYAFGLSGRTERARESLGELERGLETGYISPSLIAQVHTGLGQRTLALDWLDRAVDARAADLAWLRVRPVFDSLRSETRFTALLQRLGL